MTPRTGIAEALERKEARYTGVYICVEKISITTMCALHNKLRVDSGPYHEGNFGKAK